jgi:hypothetical protein
VDQGTCQGGSMLSGWRQAACKLILKFGDAAKVEHVMSSLPSGVSVRATDAEQRHGHVFGYGEGGEEAGVVENKSEGFIAQPPEIILRTPLYFSSVQPDSSRIARLEKSQIVHEEISARVIRTAKFVERSGRKRERHLANGSLVALVPVGSLAAKVLAGKDHLRR